MQRKCGPWELLGWIPMSQVNEPFSEIVHCILHMSIVIQCAFFKEEFACLFSSALSVDRYKSHPLSPALKAIQKMLRPTHDVENPLRWHLSHSVKSLIFQLCVEPIPVSDRRDVITCRKHEYLQESLEKRKLMFST